MFPVSGGRESFVGLCWSGKVRGHRGFLCAQGCPQPDEPRGPLLGGTLPRFPGAQQGSGSPGLVFGRPVLFIDC